MDKRDTILIATGVYPPEIGGPATYAKNMRDVWESQGYKVRVATFGIERRLPTGLRHLVYFFRVLWQSLGADKILVLDTWSVAVPTMYAVRLLRKRYVIRTGGDFLWEAYLNRTRKAVLLRNFYTTCLSDLNLKERVIFKLTRKVLGRADAVIFSTKWQRDIFEEAYTLDTKKNFVVENYYKSPVETSPSTNRDFIAGARDIRFKNLDMLEEAFGEAREEVKESGLPGINLDMAVYPHEQFIDKIRHAYAVVLVSLGDISPNTILEALRFGIPCIVTEENGISDRIKDHVLLVNPLDKNAIRDKIVWLSDPSHREELAERAKRFNFTHTWEEMGEEIMSVFEAQQ